MYDTYPVPTLTGTLADTPPSPGIPSRPAIGVGSFVGAFAGGLLGAMTAPHYDDISIGGANRTAVYGDVIAMRATVGAALGALFGGLLGSLKTTSPTTTTTTP